MQMKEVAIVIVNWNGKEILKNCLESLRKQTYRNFRIILVDNGSTDGSVSFVEKNYPEVEIVSLPENTGFAKANNIGISKAFEDENTEYILTLNNDTKPDAEFVSKILESAKRHSGFGSIQPKVLDAEGKNIDCTGILISFEMSAQNRGYGEEDKGQFGKEEEIFGSSAGAALYSRKALEKIVLPDNNYFDEGYFAYYEDVDLAWRLRLSGFKSYYSPEAKVFHIHSATGVKFSPFKKFYLHRNQYYNIFKNLSTGMMLKAVIFMPVRYSLVLSSMLMKKGSVSKTYQGSGKSMNIVKSISKGWMEVIRNFPELMDKRKTIQKNKTVKNGEIRKWFKIYKADFKKIIYG